MSSTDNFFRSAELFQEVGGVLLSCALAYASIRIFCKIEPTKLALRKISQAKPVPISDLRSLLSSNESESESSKEILVIVRGITKTNSTNMSNLTPDVLISPTSGEKCVVLEQIWDTVKRRRDQIKDLVERDWPIDMRWIWETIRETSTSSRKIPFILSGSGQGGEPSDYVFINFEGSSHSVPLTQVFDSFVGDDAYSNGGSHFLVEENILPIGKRISAVGICSLRDGNPEIKACSDLPYFLSEFTKDEMVKWLDKKHHLLFSSGCFLGISSLILLYRNFTRLLKFWKSWKEEQETKKNIQDVDKTSQDTPVENMQDGGETSLAKCEDL